MGELKTKGIQAAWDEQIKTPEHDTLCMELMKPEILGKAIIEFGLDEQVNNSISKALDNLDNQNLPIKMFDQVEYTLITEKKSENPISSEKIFTGFFRFTKVIYKRKDAYANINYDLKLEHPLLSKNFLVGVVDFRLVLKPELHSCYEITTEIYQTPDFEYKGWSKPDKSYDFDSKHKQFCIEQGILINTEYSNAIFCHQLNEEGNYSRMYNNSIPILLIEVKPKIQSVGEVVRQLRVYQEYGSQNVALFTTSDSTKELFKSQGFRFCALENIVPTAKQTGLGGWNE